MTEQKKISIEMTIDQAAAVMLALIDAQNGYGSGEATPTRIFNIRDVITNIDTAMESLVSTSVE